MKFGILLAQYILCVFVQAKKIQVHDYLRLFDNQNNLIVEYELNTFEHEERYKENTTVEGLFCLAETYEDFEANCRNNVIGNADVYKWIVANPFEIRNSNFMLRNISKDN